MGEGFRGAVVAASIAPLLVTTLLFVAAPGFVDPLFDPAVRIGGIPAGPIVVGACSLAVVLLGRAWLGSARRLSPGQAEAVAMVLLIVAVAAVPLVSALVRALADAPG